MLKRVHIRGYKSLEDVEVSLSQLVVLFGPNAAGRHWSALVGFEEPENGVHPRRIQLIAELLKTQETLRQTQYIVTTHSPILPDLLADDSLFAVRRLNGQTRIDPFSTWGPDDKGDHHASDHIHVPLGLDRRGH